MSDDNKTFDLNNIPDDAELYTGKTTFEPLDPVDKYQVEVLKAELALNKFYKPDAKNVKDRGSKYQFNFTFVIINEGKFYGRRLWRTAGLAFKPDGKKGPTILYKIVSKAMGVEMDWDACESFAPDLRTFMENLQKEIIGKQLLVAIENTVSPDTKKTFSKIVTFYAVREQLPKYQPKGDVDTEGLEDVDPNDIPF